MAESYKSITTMKELFEAAERGNDRAQYAYGRALQDGVEGAEINNENKAKAAEYIAMGKKGGINVETLERVYINAYRPFLSAVTGAKAELKS